MQSDWKTFFFFEKTDKKPVTEILKFVIYNKNYTIIEYVGVDAHLHQATLARNTKERYSAVQLDYDNSRRRV